MDQPTRTVLSGSNVRPRDDADDTLDLSDHPVAAELQSQSAEIHSRNSPSRQYTITAAFSRNSHSKASLSSSRVG
jgi:hypothetical protein